MYFLCQRCFKFKFNTSSRRRCIAGTISLSVVLVIFYVLVEADQCLRQCQSVSERLPAIASTSLTHEVAASACLVLGGDLSEQGVVAWRTGGRRASCVHASTGTVLRPPRRTTATTAHLPLPIRPTERPASRHLLHRPPMNLSQKVK